MSAYAYQDPNSKKWEMRAKRGIGANGTRFRGFNPSNRESITKACAYVGAERMTNSVCNQMCAAGYAVQ